MDLSSGILELQCWLIQACACSGRRWCDLFQRTRLNPRASRLWYQVNFPFFDYSVGSLKDDFFPSHDWLWGHHLGPILVNEIVPLLLLFRTSSHGAKAITQMLVRQTQRHFAVCFGLLLGDFLPTESWHLPKFTMNLRANFSVHTLGTLQKTFSILQRIKGASLNGIADGNIPGSKYSTASKQTLLPLFSWGRSALVFYS